MIVDATCPGCSKDHQVEVDLSSIPKAKRVHMQLQEPEIDVDSKIEAALKKLQQIEPAKEKKEEKKVLPVSSHQPFYACPNGNCDKGGIHENPQQKTKIKGKCSNCDQYTPGKKCLFCGSEDIDEIDFEELKDLGIPLPIDDHEGHSHE